LIIFVSQINDMIEKIFKGLFSMRMMTVGMIAFLVAIAVATFIESNYGTPASKIAIFNATWFELLLVYLCINLIANIFRYRLFRAEKAAVLAFHLSFIVIMIGAGVTRYIGFEGQMPILEGETTNLMYSADPYLVIRANDLKHQYTLEDRRWLSEGVQNPFQHKFQLPDQQQITVEYIAFEENMIDDVVVDDSLSGEALEFVVHGENVYLFKGEQINIGGMNFSFGVDEPLPGVKIDFDPVERQLMVESVHAFGIVDMMNLSVEDRQRNMLDSSKVQLIPTDSAVPFYNGRLYTFDQESIMFREYRKNAGRVKRKAKKEDEGMDLLTMRLSTKDEEEVVTISADADRIPTPYYVGFAGVNIELSYGAKPIRLPFSILCRDFQLDRYPGSDMPSSFASEVTVIDDSLDVHFDQRIFMNNVMDYRGYRFFQSSYFPDESGTVLSVNYDWWGTNITYLGYLLMTIGMMLSMFTASGRMRQLSNIIGKAIQRSIKGAAVVILMLAVNSAGAHDHNHDHNHDQAHEHHDHDHDHNHDHDHDHDHNHDHNHDSFDDSAFQKERPQAKYLSVSESEHLNSLMVQDRDGRIMPLHTMADRVLRKVHYAKRYKDLNPVQVVTAMHLYGPPVWNHEKIIYVSGKINDSLGVERYASITDLEDAHGNFRWITEYNTAHEKPDARKNEFDKQMIKLGERYRVMKDVLNYHFLRIVPIPDDQSGAWAWPFALELRDKDQTGNSLAVTILQELYAVSEGDAKIEKVLPSIKSLIDLQWESMAAFEKINPTADLPTPAQIYVEVAYNKLDIFSKVRSFYFLGGLLILIMFFVRITSNPSEKTERLIRRLTLIPLVLVIAIFLIHGAGFTMRAYITGYAPWSNGYEAVIFIAWITVMAGLIFVRKSTAVVGATALLAGMMLMVTEMNLLDPEITPLQPVLKSYWLMIHVAIITSSYGFLGLSAVLSLVNMLLYFFRNKVNKLRINTNVTLLTAVSEISMTIGLFMLTIGTFLGGVWANESWGRYWGWDPKETWALVSVLVYAVILHLRFIPGLNKKFLFNTVALWGYSAILFTFFGVNFILVGLHSYAQGDGVAEIPVWVWLTAIGFAVFNALSYVFYLKTKEV